jgi:signal transduction histidine kinase/DNA-binding NarL/FixJ family response regulator/ligand-binding sensor domain-containing protein
MGPRSTRIWHQAKLWCCSVIYFLPIYFTVFAVRGQSMRTITTKDGLPQSFVSGIVQDDSSFVWISTRNGLARFDGIAYKLFQHQTGDTSTLASSVIIWLRRDENNKIWIEHESGVIDEMDPVSEKITHYLKGGMDTPADINFIRRGWMVDHDGLFWGINKGRGLGTFDRKTHKLVSYTRANAGLISDTIRGIVETKAHGIWILVKGGLSYFDKSTGQFSHWPNPFPEDFGNFLNSDAIAIDLHERRNGELMWGDRSSLYFFNPNTHIFKRVALPAVSYLGVRWIRTAPDGSDYLESYGNVFHYEDHSGVTKVGRSITENFGDAKSFLVDASGIIWIGTNARGIRQIDLSIPYFRSFPNKKEFFSDLIKDQWQLDMTQVFGWAPSDDLFTNASYQFRWTYGREGRLYLSLKRTVGYIDPASKRFVKFPEVPLRNRITGISLTPQDNLMAVSTIGNIYTYSPVSKNWIPFLDTGFLWRTYGTHCIPQDMLVDDKHVWLTTLKDGLFCIDLADKSIRRFQKGQATDSLPTNEILGLCADPKQPEIMWISSFQGLIRFDKLHGSSKVYSLQEGLPDNTIYAILPDSKGYLWISTNKGLCRFDPSSAHVRVFGTQHGLPADEFNRFHAMRLPDGMLAFGSTDGWALFDPLMVKNDEFDPRLALTDLRINNKEMAWAPKNRLLPAPLNEDSALTLPYDQNTVSVGFSGLEYNQPQELHYRYRLEGYDNDWVQAGNTHQAIYTKIPSGMYTLLVNASNTSGKWSRYIKTMRLRISAPWWSTPLAYICYSIILSGLIWIFIRFRVSRMMMRREMALKEVETHQLKELDDLKTRFFSNITHEFRTPLTLIIGPAEQLKMENQGNQRVIKQADGIIYNSHQLLTLVNRLMELAKLESGSAKLLEQRGNPATIAGLVVQSFETDARSREVILTYNHGVMPRDCWFYADALERIVYNLVSNALKFTDPGGKVEASLSVDANNLVLTVTDTGVGIPEEKLPFIFDRFYQVSENSGLVEGTPDAGTGIGLAMVKELVNQMGGKIEVQSQTHSPGGTSFIVLMPFRAASSVDLEPTGPAPEPAESEVQETLERSHVLVVEDSPELAEFVTSILSGEYVVSHALNGAEGLDQALKDMPDLIISDVMMPVMNGFEFCKRVKADMRLSHIPIILLTAKASQEDRIAGLIEGANDYLPKPFHPTELLLRVHNLLEAQRKWRERIRREMSQPGFTTQLGAPGTPAPVYQPGSAILPGEEPVQDVFLTNLYSLLEEHMDDAGFGVDQLLGLVNMSRSSLHRKLKNITGLSTTEVIRNFRLSKAAEFLKEGYSSSDAAYKSGFGSPAYFTKCFREVYSITPSDFVKQVKA